MPQKKVLVFGSPAFAGDVERKQQLSRLIGGMIVDIPGCCLTTGGSRGDETRGCGADYHTALGALAAIETGHLPAGKLMTIVPTATKNSFSWGTVIPDPAPNTHLRRANLVSLADAVITLEGGFGTVTMIDLALQSKIPLIPIGCSGGASREAWKRDAITNPLRAVAMILNSDGLIETLIRENYEPESVCEACKRLLYYFLEIST